MSTLTDNLVSYWKLDESSGNATDSVGSNTLTNNNSTAFATGKINNGADFEVSSSNYLSIADNASLSITGGLSISFWWKPESHVAFTWLLGKYVISGNQRSYGIYWDSGTLSFIKSTNGTAIQQVDYTFTPSDGTWYHFVCTYDTGGNGAIYLNGASVATSSSMSTAIFDGTAPFWIGGANNDPDVDGIIDEVGIWSRALVAGEVASLYNSGSGSQYPFSGGNFLAFL